MRLAVLVLALAALGVRLVGIDWGLPAWQEPDANVAYHVDLLRTGASELDRMHSDRQYPHVVARIASLVPRGKDAPAGAPLEAHLAAASRTHVHVRIVVAVLSSLCIPLTWLLARRCLPPWPSLFAAALVATSMLHLSFSQQARPHAPAATFFLAAVLAAMGLARKPSTGAYVLAGVTAALALGCLQSGLAVLPPLLAAHLVRQESPRKLCTGRALVALALALAALPLFYPFLFRSELGSDWGSLRVEGGRLLWADHELALSDFDGTGFDVARRVLWSYDPLLFALIVAAVLVLLARARRLAAAPPSTDVAVALAFALPYLFVIGIFGKTYERFVLPLLPFLACFAAWGALELVRAGPAGARRAIAALFAVALLLPASASAKLALLRRRPDTLEQAAAWVRANVEPGAHPIRLLPSTIDLPLSRESPKPHEGGTPHGNAHFHWERYLAALPPEDRPSPRYAIERLGPRPGFAPREVERDPLGYLEACGPGLYVIEVYERRGLHASLVAIRRALSEHARRRARFSPEGVALGAEAAGDPASEFDLFFQVSDHFNDGESEGLPHQARRVLRAEAIGPVIEIYELDL